MKKQFKKIFKLVMSCIGYVITLNTKVFTIILTQIAEDKRAKFFLSFHIRPKKVDNIINDEIKIKHNIGKMGIVIQGPVVDFDFIYQTVLLYKKNFVKDEIIISTWKGLDENHKQKLNAINVHVVENDKPANGGFLNLNYQIVSTYEGIKKARELDCNYVLKTRTDIRIYEAGVKSFLISLISQFKPENKLQNGRIIGVDINTHRYGIGISDIFQFGTIEELEKMWGVGLYSQEVTYEEYRKFEKDSTGIDRFNKEFSECYLLKNYLQRIGVNITPSIRKYYQILADNFIIIDDTMINMYWNKYCGDEYKGWKNYNKIISKSSMKFKDWMTIYNNIGNIEVDESILQLTYDEWNSSKVRS